MWLWLLSALVVLLVWGAWGVLPRSEQFPLWIPAAVTALAVLVLVGRFIFRRVRAARAARALERAIAQQAEEQALAAKPERAAEIRALNRQIQQGIASLKASKLGFGKRGESAIYALPWYAIVGPPGAGKTTALRHSGLVFPYLDPDGGGVAGVGGTRNCTFWFTNEAILLDTAGRYTTEADDHDEWVAFLEQLLQHRANKPLNGVIVAISVSELLDAPSDQIQKTGQKIRARVDEMQRVLKMVLPVYVLFTKADLIAGFSEFFGDLKKSERSGPWGATIPLATDKAEPGKLFDAEFDTLVERLHDRTLRRLSSARGSEAKEKIYQFPLEFSGTKQNLSAFIATAFAPVAGAASPILRGFYFTSGVQEGRPLDRVVGAMGLAFGLSGAALEEAPVAKTESKSFFLRDVFMGVIFPDKDLAARTEAEIRRIRLQRYFAAAAALLLALLLLIPAIRSYGRNRTLVAETRRISEDAASVKWGAGEPRTVDKIDKLDPLRQSTDLLDRYRAQPPVGMTFFMYQGDKLYEPVLKQYISTLQQGFVRPTREGLEQKLGQIRPGKYLEDFDRLKTYLLLGEERRRLANDPELANWETARLTQAWADDLRRDNPGVSEEALKAKLTPHVAYYVDLLKRGEIEAEPLNQPVIDRARDVLRSAGEREVRYDRFVNVLIPQKYDENGPNTRDNLKYPPITLDELFAGQPKVRAKLHSVAQQRGGKQVEVQGPYTAKGHQQVLASLEEGEGILEREQWVVPLTLEEVQRGTKLKKDLERIRLDYDTRYIKQWEDFFRDIEVDTPKTNRDAIDEFTVLATPEWPYQRLLRALSENTQFDKPSAPSEADGARAKGKGIVEEVRRKIETSMKSGALNGLLPGAGGERRDPVTERFRSMVRFGVPAPQPPPKEGQPPAPLSPVELDTYIGKLQALTGEMGNIEDGPTSADTKKATETFEDAVKTTEGLLLKMDETGQKLMEPLLMDPLKQAYKSVVRHAGGAAIGLWETLVYPSYRDQIKERYPFNLAASRDAAFPDAVAFLKPKDGVLWGFYEQYLRPFHTKQGHDFVPEAHLQDRRRKARPFTPFNANLYNCLKRADEITEALFAEGGDKPKVDFQINLKTVSPIVSEVIFEVDGESKRYRNEKEFWKSFTWPGPKPTGARIQVRGAGGLDEEIMRDGPWGVFRLFEAGTVTAEKDSDRVFLVTWEMTAPPVRVTMEVRPSRSNHPFPTSFFRATNCPPRIGGSAGGR